MNKATFVTDLSRSIQHLELVKPVSAAPEARLWRRVVEDLKSTEAVLLTVEAFRPGLLRALESAAIEELQVEHLDPLPAISALIGRYCKRRERLR